MQTSNRVYFYSIVIGKFYRNMSIDVIWVSDCLSIGLVFSLIYFLFTLSVRHFGCLSVRLSIYFSNQNLYLFLPMYLPISMYILVCSSRIMSLSAYLFLSVSLCSTDWMNAWVLRWFSFFSFVNSQSNCL